MDDIVALRPNQKLDASRARFRPTVRIHDACEMLREARGMLLAATAIGGGLAWIAAVSPSWMSPGVRVASLAIWPAGSVLSLATWCVERHWREQAREDMEILARPEWLPGRGDGR